MAWDPDGAGPQTEVLVVGGEFTSICGVAARNIAIWNPATGLASALGSGIDLRVMALAKLPDGSVVAGCSAPAGTGTGSGMVKRWDGTAWTQLGPPMNGGVSALTLLPSGHLVAAGLFSTIGTAPRNKIAAWDGDIWLDLGGGINNVVDALAVMADGGLVVGGTFTAAGTLPTPYIAVWNGTAWSTLGSGMNGRVQSLAVLPDGSVLAGGYFTIAGGTAARGIARWDGATWSPLRGGFNGGSIYSITVMPGGDAVVSGSFSMVDGISAFNIARWDGSTWSALGSGINSSVFKTVVLSGGELAAGGSFGFSGRQPDMNSLAIWNGQAWKPVGAGIVPFPRDMKILADGTPVAATQYWYDGVVHAAVLRWDAGQWTNISGPIIGTVLEILPMPDGGMVIGGNFSGIGSLAAMSLARYRNGRWESMGFGSSDMWGFRGIVSALALTPDGRVVVGGNFTEWNVDFSPRIAVFNTRTNTWTGMGAGFSGNSAADNVNVTDLAVRPNGELLAAGTFTKCGTTPVYGVARWNGVTWSTFASSITGTPSKLLQLRNGDVIVGGNFSRIGGVPAVNIARWSNSQWSAVGDGLGWGLISLFERANGDIVAGGEFQTLGTPPIVNLASFRGSTWIPLGTGVNGTVHSITELANQELLVGGTFTTAGGLMSVNFARWSQTGAPWIWRHPSGTQIDAGQLLELSITPASNFEGVGIQWLKDGIAISDGVHGASPDGGEVTGASRQLESPAVRIPSVLRIADAQVGDAGLYTARLTNQCGESVSQAATVLVRPGCAADFNRDGGVDGSDIEAFFMAWTDGVPRADVNADGGVDGADIETFFIAWERGGCL